MNRKLRKEELMHRIRKAKPDVMEFLVEVVAETLLAMEEEIPAEASMFDDVGPVVTEPVWNVDRGIQQEEK